MYKRQIYGWIDAAKVACGMRRNRMGLLGNYYGGMVDVYSDLRLQSTVFGTHAEILETVSYTHLDVYKRQRGP